MNSFVSLRISLGSFFNGVACLEALIIILMLELTLITIYDIKGKKLLIELNYKTLFTISKTYIQ